MASKVDYSDLSMVREPMMVIPGDRPGTILALLTKMRKSAFQGRQLGEAFEAWKRMVEGDSVICLGYAGSLSSAGLWPLVTWLMERGYIDVLASTSANITEDLLETNGSSLYCVDPYDVDDGALWEQGYYRFYDHIVSREAYDHVERNLTGRFIDELAETWSKPTLPAVRFLYEFGLWLGANGLSNSILSTAARCQVPVFCCALPDGPIGNGYDKAAKRDQAPVVDFFKDYKIATDIVDAAVTAGRGTSVIFLGGGVPKDFLQITATGVAARRGDAVAQPHAAAIQITTDNTVYGGLGGATLGAECLSWGKEQKGGANVMCFADATIVLPLLCQGLSEHFGSDHRRNRPRPLHLADVF